MDSHTLALLGFEAIRERVAGQAASCLGREAALAILPSSDEAFVRHELALTTEMSETLASRLAPPLGAIPDVRPLVRRAAVDATLEADELARIVEVLHALRDLDRWLERVSEAFPRLAAMRSGVGEFAGPANAIESCIDTRGQVLDTASRRLSTIRHEIANAEERIQATLRAMLRTPEIRRIVRYPNFTMVGPHYVLPVAKEHRGEIAGSVQRTSSTNETIYIEPQAIADQSAQISYLRSKEHKELRRILRWLSAQVGQVAESLLGSTQTFTELDLIYAKARYGRLLGGTAPIISNMGVLSLGSVRHPLLIHRSEERRVSQSAALNPDSACVLDGAAGADSIGAGASPASPPRETAEVVPIDVELGRSFRMLVVTGPNTGGKTVALKTVGLLSLMAQAGLLIPARDGSELPVFDHVLADIGDEQSIEQSLSTFSSHMSRIAAITKKASDRSLVLLDELGAGTDPAEGAAIGRAILDELDSIGCRAIVTTHIGNLKTYAFTNSSAQNAAVEFDAETLRPLYRLRIGEIGASNALAIARRLDVQEHLIERAERYLEANRTEPRWDELERMRREAELAKTAASEEKSAAELVRLALEQRLEDLTLQQAQDERVADARARLQPGDRVVVPKFGYDRPGRIVRVDAKRQVAQVAIGQMKWDVPIEEILPLVMSRPSPAVEPSSARRGGARARPAPLDADD
jgi:DNA mismatch repair protein MutS2